MNLQPFYELRERLHTAANAGVNLITEDFRLQRVVSAVEPFAKASPIFAKIDQMLKQMLTPECTNRAWMLLDILALLDAVLTTQGSNGIEGELENAGCHDRDEKFFEHYKNIPAGILRPLKEAMTGTGSGRYNIIEETHNAYPEVFDDYRVQELMVKGLGDSYSEISVLYKTWLKEKGNEIIPLLKDGFDPSGKREMVHRIEIIAAIAGEKENDFYLSQLSESKKEVKEALIEALHFNPSNAQIILQLMKTEKGKAKAAAQWASGFMDTEEIREYWQKTEVNPLILGGSSYRWAADLQSQRLLKLVEKVTQNAVDNMVHEDSNEHSLKTTGVIEHSDEEKILTYLQALRGKKITDFASWIQKLAALAPKFQKLKSEKDKNSFQQIDMHLEGDGFAKALSDYLMDTLFLILEKIMITDSVTDPIIDSTPDSITNPTADLTRDMTKDITKDNEDRCAWNEYIVQVADQTKYLYQEYGVLYLGAAFAASFLTETKEQVFQTYASYLKENGMLEIQKKKKKSERIQIYKFFSHLQYNREKKTYLYKYKRGLSWKGEYQADCMICTGKDLSLDWYPLIFKIKEEENDTGKKNSRSVSYYSPYTEHERIVRELFRIDTEELRRWYGNYFYRQVCKNRWYGNDLDLLKECGWKDFRGILKHRLLVQDLYWLHNITDDMGLGKEEIIQEMEEAKAQMGSSKAASAARIAHWIQQLKDGASISGLT